MVRPNYKDFRRSKFVVANKCNLVHSAKGSTWEEHKYIKRVNGTYYYPDSYKGGRHLSDGEKSGNDDSKDKLEDWEKIMYEDIDKVLKAKPGLFDPTKIASDDFQDFRLTLSEFAGVDTDKLSDEEIERMRKKVQSHYDDEKAARTLGEGDIKKLAKEVIRGNFGTGQQRKDLLGKNYAEVQKRVNENMRNTGSKKVSNAPKISEKLAKKNEDVKASERPRSDSINRLRNTYVRDSGSKKVSEASKDSVRKVDELAKKIGNVKVSENGESVSINRLRYTYRR